MHPSSRRQRYFRPLSPPGPSSSTGVGVGGQQQQQAGSSGGGGGHRSMNQSNLNVLEQAELVIDGGDDQEVSHEEIVDDGSSEMVVDHHQHHQQQQQHRPNPMHHHQQHYDTRQQQQQPQQQQSQQPQSSSTTTVYQVQQAQGIRRAIGRPNTTRPAPSSAYPPNPMDMVQKLQNKNVYLPQQQRPQTRISPAGARIVSFAGRKRDNSEALPPGVKKMSMAPGRPVPQQVQQVPQQKTLQSVKVVRLATSSARANPSASAHALNDIEESIKQTIENSKIDMERLRELQEADFSPEEYHHYLGMMLIDLERSNDANLTLNNYYRERQRHEKTIWEAQENAYAARIRQLETENRKLRDSIHAMYYGKYNDASGHSMYRNDHMGQMMEPEEHVVIEGHVDNQQESEEVPQEWIVEEAVDEQHRMHLQGLGESDDHHQMEHQQQQQEGDQNDEEEDVVEDDEDEQNDDGKEKNDQFGGVAGPSGSA